MIILYVISQLLTLGAMVYYFATGQDTMALFMTIICCYCGIMAKIEYEKEKE